MPASYAADDAARSLRWTTRSFRALASRKPEVPTSQYPLATLANAVTAACAPLRQGGGRRDDWAVNLPARSRQRLAQKPGPLRRAGHKECRVLARKNEPRAHLD